MSRFAPALRRVASELDLPAGMRAAIVLEMAADLDAVYEHHLAQGASEGEAARLAEEMVLGSTEVTRRLGRLHHDSWRSWPSSPVAPGRTDLLLLLAAVLPITTFAGIVGLGGAAATAGAPFWALLAVGAALVVATAVEASRLRVAGRASSPGLPVLPVLAAVAPMLGLLAFVFELRAVADGLATGATGATLVANADRLSRGGALFLVGLLLGVAGALAWYILVSRAAVRAAREVDSLLRSGGPPPATAASLDVLPLRRRRHS